MSTTKKKIGDRIRITGGRYKDRIGVITGKERRSWTVELEDGRQVNVSFPMVALVEASAQTEQAGGEQAQETAESESPATEAESPQKADPAAGTTSQPDHTDNTADRAIQADTNDNEPEDLTKLTVKQLQALAKRRGISVARTKSDFLRIIRAKFPDEDLQRLKGKALFDRVGELHISRLRSKEDLLRLLQAAGDGLTAGSRAEYQQNDAKDGMVALRDASSVRVPVAVLEGLMAVRRSGFTNMLDRPVVAELAKKLGFPDAARWIEAHPKEYAEGVFQGFEATHEGGNS